MRLVKLRFQTLVIVAGMVLAIASDTSAQGDLKLGTNLKEFAGTTRWLNTNALDKKDLEGKVVAIDFYTSGCSNCRAAVAHVVSLYNKFHQRGLVVVGVHTPEMSYEHDIDTVQKMAKELRITYPIAIDNQHEIWSAYQNLYWPNILIFNRQGKLVYQHAGEGDYDEIERTVSELL